MLGRILLGGLHPQLAQPMQALLGQLGVENEAPPARIHDDLDWPGYLGAILPTAEVESLERELPLAVARIRQFRPDLPIALSVHRGCPWSSESLAGLLARVVSHPCVVEVPEVVLADLASPHCFPLLREERLNGPGVEEILRCHFRII